MSSIKDLKDTQKTEYIVNQVFELVNEAISTIREISNDLSPHILNNYGLHAATEQIISKFNDFISFNWSSNIDKLRFETNIELIYYRIVKELINNTIKHSEASNVSLSLIFENNTLSLNYSDNGKGFSDDMNQSKEGLGLNNITSRIQSINGKYNMKSEIGKGFSFNLQVKVNLIDE